MDIKAGRQVQHIPSGYTPGRIAALNKRAYEEQGGKQGGAVRATRAANLNGDTQEPKNEASNTSK
jgi:hypothetical protein